MALSFREFLVISEAFKEAEGTQLDEGAIWDKIKTTLSKSGSETGEEKMARLKKEFEERKAKSKKKDDDKLNQAKTRDSVMATRMSAAAAAKAALSNTDPNKLTAGQRRHLEAHPFDESKELELEQNFKRLTEAQDFIVTYELKTSDVPKKVVISGGNATKAKRKFEDTHIGAKVLTIVPKPKKRIEEPIVTKRNNLK